MDTKELTVIQRSALARAVGLAVSNLNDGDQAQFIDVYDALVAAAESDGDIHIPEHITIWGGLNGYTLNDVLDFIDKEYDINMSMISDILGYIKDGLVNAACDDELGLDANNWDLEGFAERGYNLEADAQSE